jgi:hypothetical protein
MSSAGMVIASREIDSPTMNKCHASRID